MTKYAITDVSALLYRKVTKKYRLKAAAKSADCFLASYPKSGRTWLRYIISNYLNVTYEVIPEINLHTTFRLVPNFDLDPERGVPAFKKANAQSKLPLILVTHLRHNPVLFRNRPVIFLIRDPRDVLVSSYFHAVYHKKRFSGDMTAFLEDDQGVTALTDYLNSWAAGLSSHPHWVASYESLSSDTVVTVKSVLEFIGLEVSNQALLKAVELSSFERMRENEQKIGIPGHDYDRDDKQSGRMRKGVAGGFRDTLNARQIDYISARLSGELSPEAQSILKKTGFNLLSAT